MIAKRSVICIGTATTHVLLFEDGAAVIVGMAGIGETAWCGLDNRWWWAGSMINEVIVLLNLLLICSSVYHASPHLAI